MVLCTVYLKDIQIISIGYIPLSMHGHKILPASKSQNNLWCTSVMPHVFPSESCNHVFQRLHFSNILLLNVDVDFNLLKWSTGHRLIELSISQFNASGLNTQVWRIHVTLAWHIIPHPNSKSKQALIFNTPQVNTCNNRTIQCNNVSNQIIDVSMFFQLVRAVSKLKYNGTFLKSIDPFTPLSVTAMVYNKSIAITVTMHVWNFTIHSRISQVFIPSLYRFSFHSGIRTPLQRLNICM